MNLPVITILGIFLKLIGLTFFACSFVGSKITRIVICILVFLGVLSDALYPGHNLGDLYVKVTIGVILLSIYIAILGSVIFFDKEKDDKETKK